jgi:RNA polymerase-binding transcription factor DksA
MRRVGIMTRLELSVFRNALQNIRSELLYARRRREFSAIRTMQGSNIQRTLVIEFPEHDVIPMTAIRSALSRIDAGLFGTCLDCEREIGLKRLAAMPWAALCSVCQPAGSHRLNHARTDNNVPVRDPAGREDDCGRSLRW